MKVDWNPPSGYEGAAQGGYADPDGTVLLTTTRNTASGTYAIVGEVDGPVRASLLMTAPKICIGGPSILQGATARRYDFQIYENEKFYRGGFFAGTVDELQPSFAVRYPFRADDSHTFQPGQPGLLHLSESPSKALSWDILEWGTGKLLAHVTSPAEDKGLQPTFPFFFRDSLFWTSGTQYELKVRVWTTSGTRDFITFGSDPAHGAADLGTDGTDMVWVEGFGRSDGGPLFDSAAFMTSPFTLDSAQLRPRRLRSEIANGVGVSTTHVGCGYAARQVAWGVRVVRISDGRSWRLESQGPWSWGAPIAITCTELLARRPSGAV